MKKLLLLTTAFAAIGFARAQTIANGNFENWTPTTFDKLDGWKTTNEENEGTPAVIKTTDSRSGFAIQLSTVDFRNERSFGFFTNTDGDPIAGEGGIPYTQQPTSISGYYKCNVVAGDSAIFLVVFKKQGTVIGMNLIKFAGTVTNFTQFTLPLNLGVTPDSIIIAGASGNVEAGENPPLGSTITFDDIMLNGTGITQQLPNGNFENWTSVTNYDLPGWSIYNEGVTRTTDKYKGETAIRMTPFEIEQGQVIGGGLMLGMVDRNNINTVYVPYTKGNDSLVLWYKFTSVDGDSAGVSMSFKKGNTPVGTVMSYLTPVAQYTRKAIAIVTTDVADSMSLTMGAGTFQFVPHLGSVLTVDEMTLASEPLNTGLKQWSKSQNSFSVYPNPCKDVLSVQITDHSFANQPVTYSVNDIAGKIIRSGSLLNNEINVSDLNNGIYFVTLKVNAQVLAVKKVIKE